MDGKIIKKMQKLIFSMMLVIAVLLPVTIYGRALDKLLVNLTIIGYSGDGTLSLYADESIFDDNGDIIIEKDTPIECNFEKSGNDYLGNTSLYSDVRYYVSDGVKKAQFVPTSLNVTISMSDGSALNSDMNTETVEDISVIDDSDTALSNSEPLKNVLGISTKSINKANVGDTITYIVDNIKGATDTLSDTFLLQCSVPEKMKLKSIYTGSYTNDVNLELLYKTESDNEWHSYGHSLSSLKGTRIDVDELGINADDNITIFALSAESVPEGFALKKDDPCSYDMEVLEDGANIENSLAKVTAYVGDAKASSESYFMTTLATISANGVNGNGNVQTGDDNYLYIGSVILMVVSLLVGISYIIVRIITYKKEEIATRPGSPVTFKKTKTTGDGRKMAELLGKKPG